MFSIAFYAFLRPSEMCSSDHTLQLSDVEFHNTQLLVKFKSFKHHTGAPVTITIPKTSSSVCPVLNLRKFVKLRGRQPGPLFCSPIGKPISYKNFSKVLARVVNRSSLSGKFAPHSFRIGAATYVATLGYPDHLIQKLGRWKCMGWISYVRRNNVRFAL